jgi:diguanylate cyclase (GGDEF)-like protein/PAS domain S-box-containing protein
LSLDNSVDRMLASALPSSRLFGVLVAVVASLVAVGLPLVYFGLGYGALDSALETEAKVKAEIINQAISASPEMWRFEEQRLGELLDRFPIQLESEQAQILTDGGELIAASDHRIERPMMIRSAPLFDSGTPVGRVEVRRSLRGLFLGTGFAALLSGAVAIVLFGLLRALRARESRIVDAMFDEQERARVTLDSIGDAVITTDAAMRIEYLNPVAERLTQWTLAEARGRPLSDVMPLINEATRQPTSTPMDQVLRENRSAPFSREVALMQRDGSPLAIEDGAAPIQDRQGRVIGGVTVFRDVTAARSMAHRISWAATHDILTGLVNRQEFEDRVDAALATARNSAKHHALLYMDLDRFKVVNDTSGHAAGDSLLKQVSTLFQEKLRESDTLARLGGDEFGVLLDGCPLDRAERIAADLLAAIGDFRFNRDGRTFTVGVSIGLAAIAEGSGSRAEVFGAADAACYAAKEQGRNRVCVFHNSVDRPGAGAR